MRIDIEETHLHHSAVIAVRSENLDASNIKAFKDAAVPVLESHNAVLVDMSALTFVDSSGLGPLLSWLRTMKARNGQLLLVGMTKPVRALFELVRMHRIFAIYNLLDEALDEARAA